MTISLAIVLGFFALAVVIGLLARRGRAFGLHDWALGNRGFGSLLLFLLMTGENLTTFTFLGASGWAYGKGVAAFFVLAYASLAYLAGYWMMPPVWRYAKQHGLVSFADYFAHKYESRALGMLVAVVALLGLASLLTTQLRGLTLIVSEASYGALPPVASVAIGTTAMVSYILVSGIRGSAAISVIKDILIVITACVLGLYLPHHYFGGLRPMFAAVAKARPELMHLGLAGYGPAWYTSTVVLVGLGYYMYPHTFTALFAARDEQVVRRNIAFMPMAQLVLFLMFLVGFTAILIVPGLRGADGDLALLRLVKLTFPPWVVGLIGGMGVLMALVPGSMILLNAAMLIANNLYRDAFNPSATEAQIARVARVALPLVAVTVAGFVITRNIAFVGLLVLAASLLTQLFPTFIFSVFPRRIGNKSGAFAGIASGTALVIYFAATDRSPADLIPGLPGWLRELNSGLLALAVNALTFLGVSAFAPAHRRP